MEWIPFSPTSKSAKEVSNRLSKTQTARTLFQDEEDRTVPKEDQTSLKQPLSVITNAPQQPVENIDDKKTPVGNVTHLKDWLVNIEKKNRNTNIDSTATNIDKESKSSGNKRSDQSKFILPKPRNNTKNISSNDKNKVLSMQKKIFQNPPSSSSARDNTPSRVRSIPMNKVTEMRKVLLDFEHSQKKKVRNLSSKKRAVIEARLNKVEDIRSWLNEMEHERKSNAHSSKQLNLPPNRVSDMKNWLLEFERQNKKHFQQYQTKITNLTGHQKKISDIPEITLDDDNSIDSGKMPLVSDLAKWLVQFEQKNKKHFENNQIIRSLEIKRDSSNETCSITEDYRDESDKENSDSEYTDEEDIDLVEESNEYSLVRSNEGEIDKVLSLDEEKNDNVIVENTSFLLQSSPNEEVDMSMMPVVQIDDDIDWEDNTDFNISPVESVESWKEEEGFIVPSTNYIPKKEDESIMVTDNKPSEMNVKLGQENFEGKILSVERTNESYDNTKKENKMNQDEKILVNSRDKEKRSVEHSINEVYEAQENILSDKRTNLTCTQDYMVVDEAKVYGTIPPKLAKEEINENVDKDNEIKVESEVDMYDKIIPKLIEENLNKDDKLLKVASEVDFYGTKLSKLTKKEIEENLNKDDELLGEEILSSSIYGSRFSDISSVEKRAKSAARSNKTMGREGITKKKKKGIGKLLKALGKLFSNPKKDKHRSNLEHEEEFDDFEDVNISPKMQSIKKYLPDYSIDTRQNNEDNPVSSYSQDCGAETPMSLASAFMRALSPVSSSCSNPDNEESIDVLDTTVLRREVSTNVSQHVGWLKGVYSSPMAVGKSKNKKVYL